jgi:hypothetical protein
MRAVVVVVAVVALLALGFGAARLIGQGPADATPSPAALSSPGAAAAASPVATPDVTRVPSASPSPTPDVPTPVLDGKIAPIAGWSSLARMTGSANDTEGRGTLSGDMESDWHSVLISVACAGEGKIHIESGDDTRDVACPVKPAAAVRIVSFADTPSYGVNVTSSGSLAYEVRVDGAPSVLARPPVMVAGTGKAARMTEGCGIYIDLAFGYQAIDDCATSLPGDPIPTVRVRDGRVDILIPDWTITGGTVRCGRIGSDDIPNFVPLPRCRPAAHIDGSTATITGLPTTGGARLLEFGFTARNAAGDEFGVPYYAWVRP